MQYTLFTCLHGICTEPAQTLCPTFVLEYPFILRLIITFKINIHIRQCCFYIIFTRILITFRLTVKYRPVWPVVNEWSDLLCHLHPFTGNKGGTVAYNVYVISRSTVKVHITTINQSIVQWAYKIKYIFLL